MKPSIYILGLALFAVVILGLTLRGLPGNPPAEALGTSTWADEGPLELSPDRGRYALTYSIIEDRSVFFSLPIARFATPDLAVRPDGRYVSLFAPGVSYITAPGFLIGKQFGLAQVGTFAVIALFALFNVLLIRALSIHLGAHPVAASLAGLVFLFATPAFTYAVTLYQHHISVFLILMSIYLLLTKRTGWSLAGVWFLVGASLPIDNPNVILMIPIAIVAGLRTIGYVNDGKHVSVAVRATTIAALAGIIIPIALFMRFNLVANGSPFQLAGTLRSVPGINEEGRPINADGAELGAVKEEKTAVNFFRTRNLLNSFFIHFLSPDRGIIYFAPIILFGFIGLWLLYSANAGAANLFMGIIGANVILYSLWGDPWGGWAFGSRYLIPTYALLAISLSLVLTKWRRNIIFLAIFSLVTAYSVWVNALGAVSSSKNPPRIQVLALEAASGKEEKFTYERNLDVLKRNESKSFMFQTKFRDWMSAVTFHRMVTMLILLAMALHIWRLTTTRHP